MELEGVVHNGVIVPDDATALAEGTRVRITPASQKQFPPHCKTPEERERYQSIVSQIPSYEELTQIVINPRLEWATSP